MFFEEMVVKSIYRWVQPDSKTTAAANNVNFFKLLLPGYHMLHDYMYEATTIGLSAI